MPYHKSASEVAEILRDVYNDEGECTWLISRELLCELSGRQLLKNSVVEEIMKRCVNRGIYLLPLRRSRNEFILFAPEHIEDLEDYHVEDYL